MRTSRINLISGPRNISTAVMYSFANRPDTEVVDEPMYAYYLSHTKIDYHPAKDEILLSLPQGMSRVKETLFFQEVNRPVYFIKGMAHHYVDVDLSFLTNLKNVFLIRDPYQLIASFAQIIDSPTLDDIGLKKEWEICQYLLEKGEKPIVIDSNTVLSNPERELRNLCSWLDIDFRMEMLSWSAGPITQDGIWAKHWYKNVWSSTGFQLQKTSNRILPERLRGVYEESLKYYNLLKSL